MNKKEIAQAQELIDSVRRGDPPTLVEAVFPVADEAEKVEVAKTVIKAAASVLIDAVLSILQDDPHQWSDRPCETCRNIGSIVGKPFGCYEFQRRRLTR